MRRYDINIDCPPGSRVDVETLREVLPEWVDAADEADAEAMIAAALSRWAEDRHERILEHVAVWPSRVHVRERLYPRHGYGHPTAPRVRILARRRIQEVPTGPWMHTGDEAVPWRATLGIRTEWRWLGRTEGVWSARPWDDESWEWVADEAATGPAPEPQPRLEVWLALDPDEQWHQQVVLVDTDKGTELTSLSVHRHLADAVSWARRQSVQLGLPLLVPKEMDQEAAP